MENNFEKQRQPALPTPRFMIKCSSFSGVHHRAKKPMERPETDWDAHRNSIYSREGCKEGEMGDTINSTRKLPIMKENVYQKGTVYS